MPFDVNESPDPAHSDDYDMSVCASQNRIKKQASSDIKAIKIKRLIDFHREM